MSLPFLPVSLKFHLQKLSYFGTKTSDHLHINGIASYISYFCASMKSAFFKGLKNERKKNKAKTIKMWRKVVESGGKLVSLLPNP